MAMPLKSSREFRKGRVLANKDEDFILIHTPSPRQWIGVITAEGKNPIVVTRTAPVLQKTYDQYFVSGTRWPINGAELVATLNTLELAHGLPATKLEWRARYSLSKASSAKYTGTGEVKAATLTKDPTAVKESIEAKKRSSVFSTPTADAEPYWYEAPEDEKLLRDFISLHQAGFTVNLMIAGPSGAGKTVGVEKLGKKLGVPVHKINCQAITTPEKWLGQMMADPARGTYFEPSQHIQWVEREHPDCEGAEFCIMLYDEITRLRPELNNMTYSLFDTQRGLEVPQMGRTVRMHKKNLVISTANIGAAFAGTFGQDRAFRERFSMTMERDFPPLGEEIKILTSATGIGNTDAITLCKIAEASRNMWKRQEIEQPISTRTLVTWALLVAGGYSVAQAAEYTVLPMYSEDGGPDSDRAKIRLQTEGKSR